MNVFEAIMLICFGLAWPFSIYKLYKTKSSEGKSLLFLIVLQIGYISGIIYKSTEIYESGILNYNIFLYGLNLIMVTIDEILFLKYRKAKGQ